MAIATLDQYIAAAKQRVEFTKTAARTTIATFWFTTWDLAGNPGAGTLAVGNTANGLVPVGNTPTAGAPKLTAFGGAALGYLSKVEFGNTVAGRIMLYDRLFHAGAYAFNAAVTLATIPSYATRLPSTDYKGTEIWIECVTAFTGNMSIAVTYTNQDGTAGRTTGVVATGIAPTIGRMRQLPLQAGDSGVQQINSVTATVATVGTFNVLVMRPLWMGRCRLAGDGDVHDLLKTGMPQLFADAALAVAVAPDSTAIGVPDLMFEIANA